MYFRWEKANGDACYELYTRLHLNCFSISEGILVIITVFLQE